MGIAALRALVIASTSLFAGACAQDGATLASLAGQPSASAGITTAATPQAPASPEQVRAELIKATNYWGETYQKNPADAQAAYNYARNLKALGEKQKALQILQAAHEGNPTHKGLLSEYGRLALEFDQVSLAQKLLERADDPAQPDWRIISARGTVLAKQGLYRDAVPFYERALAIAPDQPSVLSNLALAYTMDGHADKAEPLLRKASAAPKADERVSQNLALVLSLQGKDDSKPQAAEPVEVAPEAPAPKKLAAKKAPDAKKATKSAWAADIFTEQ